LDGAIGREPSLLVANLNVGNLTSSETGVKQSFLSFLATKIIIHTEGVIASPTKKFGTKNQENELPLMIKNQKADDHEIFFT